MVWEKFKILLNYLFNLLGFKLSTLDSYNRLHSHLNKQYIQLIKETERFFREIIFPELPACDNRIELIARLLGTQVSEAMYLLAFLHKSLKVGGDVCEFGVAQGATSALLANEIRTTRKNIWLFDSFEGLPKPTENDLLINDIFNLGSMEEYEGAMSYPVDMVRSSLKDISFPHQRIKIISGFIEEVINYDDLPDKICFAYVDFDFYQPTLIALNFLNKKLSVNGFIIVDDYGFFSSGVKTAVDEFMKEHTDNYEIFFPYKFAGHFCILQKKIEFEK